MQWTAIEQAISCAENRDFNVCQARSIAGGSINSAYVIEGNKQKYFVKINSAKYSEMFAAEASGLIELQKSNAIKVPRPICWDIQGSTTFIVLEYIEMGRGNRDSSLLLGQQLAALHRITDLHYGWYRNNTIGSTLQINAHKTSWINFYHEHRLEFQISLAVNQGYNGELKILGAKLCDNLESFFSSYTPIASLLHGDLWSGNYAYDLSGSPVIFDPAVYYGDRETDLAITELFGGFPASFYQSYNDSYPLDPGYQVRKDLYNLYHVLNHLNLFGGGYYQQAVSIMRKLLAAIS